MGLVGFFINSTTMTNKQLIHFFDIRPALSKSKVAEEAGIGRRTLSYMEQVTKNSVELLHKTKKTNFYRYLNDMDGGINYEHTQSRQPPHIRY